MARLPKDCTPRIIGDTAVGLLHAKLPKEHWTYHGLTGTDHGTDCDIELIEHEEYTNKHIFGQIKGTTKPEFLKDGDISFGLDVKVINYGLSSSTAFVLFLVDVLGEVVYYLPLQDYFIANKWLFTKAKKESGKITVHIPVDSKISDDDFELCQIAKSVYVDGPGEHLKKIR